MSLASIAAAEAIARLDSFQTIIDARSPAEFAEDHLPGAVNWPVLDNDERRVVGTEYVQVSAFDARKHGAAIVAKRIGELLEAHVQDKPHAWSPLVYCWRGGQRSGTLAWFLAQIGFRTTVLKGGYKAFREQVREQLAHAAAALRLRRHRGPHGQRQDAPAARPGRGGCAGARPGRPGPAPRLGARRPAARAATDAKGLRDAGLDCAVGPRPLATGVCREREPQDRPAAGADRPARAHAQRQPRGDGDDARRGADSTAARGVRLLRREGGSLLRPPRHAGRDARPRHRQAVAGAGARRPLGRGVRRADARSLRPAVPEVDTEQLRPGWCGTVAAVARRQRRGAARSGHACC